MNTFKNLKKRCPHRSGNYGQLCMLINSTYDQCKKFHCPVLKDREEFFDGYSGIKDQQVHSSEVSGCVCDKGHDITGLDK